MPLLMLLFLALVAASLEYRRRHPIQTANWHQRYKSAKFWLGYFAILWVVMCIHYFTDDQPFWPREAFWLFCWTGVVGIHIYQWRRAKRKAAEEPVPPPRTPKRRSPSFLGQTALILLPLVVLAFLAGWALVLDRRSAQAEANARAGEIAAAALKATQNAFQIVGFYLPGWSPTQGRDRFTVNDRFELVAPAPRVWPPKPSPLTTSDFSNLQPRKLDQWREAEAAFDDGAWARAADLYLKFLEGRRQLGNELRADINAGIGSRRFRPIALFKRAVALERLGGTAAAIEACDDVFGGFVSGQSGRSESGLLFGPLATLKILDLAQNQIDALPEDWRKNPGFLISELTQSEVSPLSEEAIRRLKALGPALGAAASESRTLEQLFDIWERFAQARERYAEAYAEQHTNAWPQIFWVNGTERWLAFRQRPPESKLNLSSSLNAIRVAGFVYAVLPQKWLSQQIRNRVEELDPRHDFTVIVDIAGESFSVSAAPRESGESGGGLGQMLRAQDQPVAVSVNLNDPNAYFQTVERRQWLFGALIVSVLIAGSVAAWVFRRSLLEQLALNEQKSNFVSSVSHELRAPIASVRLLAESLERGKISEPTKQNEYFRFIGQECRRLSALIENVLDFSRIEQGRKQYEFEPTDIRALVEQTVKLMAPYAAERGVKLELKNDCQSNERQENKGANQRTATSEFPSPGLTATLSPSEGERDGVRGRIELNVDGRAIQQALVNLIDNAIKHSPKDAVVTVSLTAATADAESKIEDEGRERARGGADESSRFTPHASRLHISVTDRGPGIPASEHEKIFERFYRLGSELRRETPGVGIGLSIVKHVVEAHGGRVRVQSAVGQGSRFTVELHRSNAKTQRSQDAEKT